MADTRANNLAKAVESLGKLLEGYLDPIEEFALRIETLESMCDTAMSIAADIYSYSESYDEDLGAYREVIETIQDLLRNLSDQICAISEDLDEELNDEDEEETDEPADPEEY